MAYDCFLKAAEQGDKDAQYNVGVLYYYGEGIEKNIQMAHEWFLKAAEQGCSYALDALKNFSGTIKNGDIFYSYILHNPLYKINTQDFPKFSTNRKMDRIYDVIP